MSVEDNFDPFEEAWADWKEKREVAEKKDLTVYEDYFHWRIYQRIYDKNEDNGRGKFPDLWKEEDKTRILFSGFYPEECQEVFADGFFPESFVDEDGAEESLLDQEGRNKEEQEVLSSDYYLPGERPWPPIIRLNEYRAILWLSKRLEYDFSDLVTIIKRIRKGELLYSVFSIKKANGGRRDIHNPYPFLKHLQRKINKVILSELDVHPNAFGFSKKGIQEAIRPHLEAKSILCVDCQNAFPSVSKKHIMNVLTEGWGVSRFGKNQHGKYSWYAARIIAELTTYGGEPAFLPQGAPTSPRIFDAICYNMDRKLSNLAENVGGRYTRYADNIFFSFHQEHFPTPVRRAVLKIVAGRRRPNEPSFMYHKLKIRTMGNNSIRILGLNIIDGKINNNRDYKNRVKLLIHHLNWLLDNGQEYEDELYEFRGLMSFAVKDTWPEPLKRSYEELTRRFEK